MGNTTSSTRTATQAPESRNFQNQERRVRFEEDRRKRQELIDENTRGLNLSLPTCSTPSKPFPSFMQEIESQLPSSHILSKPQVTPISVSTKDGSATISASMSTERLGKYSIRNEGSLSISKKFKGGQFDIRTNSSGSFNGALFVQPDPTVTFGGMLDTNGMGMVSWETDMGLCKDHTLRLGSRCEFQSPSQFVTLSDSKMTASGVHAAVFLPNSVMAVDATAPVDTLKPDLSYHLSADIGESGGHPLIMSLHKSSEKASVSVTHLNNNKKLAWTLEMEKKAHKSTSDAKAGLILRLDDAVGVKAVATPSRLDGALTITSQDARAKFSLLFGINSNKASVTGVTLELDS